MFKSIFNKKPQFDRLGMLRFLEKESKKVSYNKYGMIKIEDPTIPSVSINVSGRPAYLRQVLVLERLFKLLGRLRVQISNKDEVASFMRDHLTRAGLYTSHIEDEIYTKPSLTSTIGAVEILHYCDAKLENDKVRELVLNYRDKKSILYKAAADSSYLELYYGIALFAQDLDCLKEIGDMLREDIERFKTEDGYYHAKKTINKKYVTHKLLDTIYAHDALEILGANNEDLEKLKKYITHERGKNAKRLYKNSKKEFLKKIAREWDGESFAGPANERDFHAQSSTLQDINYFGGQELIDEVFNITD